MLVQSSPSHSTNQLKQWMGECAPFCMTTLMGNMMSNNEGWGYRYALILILNKFHNIYIYPISIDLLYVLTVLMYDITSHHITSYPILSSMPLIFSTHLRPCFRTGQQSSPAQPQPAQPTATPVARCSTAMKSWGLNLSSTKEWLEMVSSSPWCSTMANHLTPGLPWGLVG